MNSDAPPPPVPPNKNPARQNESSDVIDVTPPQDIADTTATLNNARKNVGKFGIALSLVLAVAADALQAGTGTVAAYAVDPVMVVALLLLWGLRWELALVIIPEAIPGISVFPTWTLFVAYLAGQQIMSAKNRPLP